MKAYQVIGGQYERSWYGESDSLRGAKIIAGKHKEYWDNWQGWQTPKIYKAEDCEEIETKGWVSFIPMIIVRELLIVVRQMIYQMIYLRNIG